MVLLLLTTALLATFARSEVKYYNATGASITDYVNTTSSIFFEYTKDTVYRSLHGAKVQLLNDNVLKAEQGEILEVVQCTVAECYLAVIEAIDVIAQEITVSQYAIKSFSDLKTRLNVTSIQISKAIAAMGTLNFSVK